MIPEVRHLTSLRQPSIRDVSFDLHKGEILGIAGLVGAKRTDIVETLFGIREKSSGTITLHGKKINNHTANEAINHGFALVTEERRSTGIYAYLDIGFNSLISNIRNYKNKVGLLDNSRMKSDTQWVIDSMRVKRRGIARKLVRFPAAISKGDHWSLAINAAGNINAGRTDPRH